MREVPPAPANARALDLGADKSPYRELLGSRGYEVKTLDITTDGGADYAGTAETALRQLDEGHDAWVRDVRNLGTAGLIQPQGKLSPPQYADVPMARLVMHIHREVIHHGAEICLLRDLYLRKDD